MAGWHIGVIVDSALPALAGFDEAQEIPVASAFGEPSGPVLTGTIAGVRFSCVARHGEGHRIGPGQINHRANIDVLKRCGVSDVVALATIQPLADGTPPGARLLAEQLIDCTRNQASSFFGDGIVAQVPFAEPFCPRLSALVAQAAAADGGAPARPGGAFAVTDRPQLPTAAELALYRQWGAQAMATAAMPEAALAREAELPYALLGISSDGQRPGDNAGQLLAALARVLPADRTASPIDRVLDGAILTPGTHWTPAALARLDAVARRLIDSA